MNSTKVNKNIMKSLQTIFYYVVFVFYLFKKSFWHIYSFIYGCSGSLLLHEASTVVWHAGATLCCNAWASHCGSFSCCGTWALGARALAVVAHGLSCSRECGYLPRPGIKPMSPCTGKQILLPLRHQRSLFCS